MIVSFNFYYARPGQEDAVLRQRLRACDVRATIGVPRGRVLARTAGAADLPDVIWEHHFDDVAGHHADMAVRAASPEFEAVRAGMRKLCRRFERPLFEICADAGPTSVAASGSVILDWFFCAPDAQELARLTQHESGGGRLLRLLTPGTDLPGFIWQSDGIEAPRSASVTRTVAAGATAQRLEHSVWKVM